MALHLLALEPPSQPVATHLASQQLKAKLLQHLLLDSKQPPKQHLHLARLTLALVLDSHNQHHQLLVASTLAGQQLLPHPALALGLVRHNQLLVHHQVCQLLGQAQPSLHQVALLCFAWQSLHAVFNHMSLRLSCTASHVIVDTAVRPVFKPVHRLCFEAWCLSLVQSTAIAHSAACCCVKGVPAGRVHSTLQDA